MNEPAYDIDRHWDTPDTEEYVLSVCLHNKQALAKAMTSLEGIRDFKGANQKAFSVIESRYEAGKELDPVVIIDTWTDLGIYPKGEAKRIAHCYNGDTDYEQKISALQKTGGMRRARTDIADINELSKKDITPQQLAAKALPKVISWTSGEHKKYYSAEEVDQIENSESDGRRLRQGIPLLDNTVYRYDGQRRGTMKATILREKHGKTRHACWEVAQDLRRGHKVLYITLEGVASDITGNIKQVLQHEYDDFKDNLFLCDGMVDIDEIRSVIIEAIFTEDIDKVVIDYLQLMKQPNARQISENVNSNRCCQDIRELMTKHKIHVHMLAQSRQADRQKRGYNNTPEVYDIYGSNELIKAASMILVGIRPKNYEELHDTTNVPPYKSGVKDPDGNVVSLHSVFLKPILSRKKLDCQHKWMHFVDTDEGLKLKKQELI